MHAQEIRYKAVCHRKITPCVYIKILVLQISNLPSTEISVSHNLLVTRNEKIATNN
jgi:hypothetical protein